MKALITGASSGIGMDMSFYLGSLGWDLILISRNVDALQKIKDKIVKHNKVSVEIIQSDLSLDNSPFELYKRCRNKNIDMLINNAGYGIFGNFTKTNLNEELAMLNVNIKAVHILTKLFLNDFKAKNHGIILNTASSAGFMAGPLFSSYYASKSYVVNLTLAIAEELRRENSNVKISVLCPGPVDTGFNKRAGVSFKIKAADSQSVAEYAIRQTFKGKVIIIPTLKMKLAVYGSKLMPYTSLSKITYNIQNNKKH
jgi:short-subunit dehydrogenase